MVLPTDSIAGPVYRYDTEAISKRPSPSSVSVSSVTSPPSIPHIHPGLLTSLNSLPGGALLLDLLVVVVAGVGARDVVAVPNTWLDTQISVTCVGRSCSRVVAPEGVAEGEAETCRRLVLPPSPCQTQLQMSGVENSPSAMLRSVMRPRRSIYSPVSCCSSSCPSGRAGQRPLGRPDPRDHTYASDGLDGHCFSGFVGGAR